MQHLRNFQKFFHTPW